MNYKTLHDITDYMIGIKQLKYPQNWFLFEDTKKFQNLQTTTKLPIQIPCPQTPKSPLLPGVLNSLPSATSHLESVYTAPPPPSLTASIDVVLSSGSSSVTKCSQSIIGVKIISSMIGGSQTCNTKVLVADMT